LAYVDILNLAYNNINRAFIKGTNWALAGLISLLGFVGCEKNGMVSLR
jgi:hypothetical protein